VSDREQPGWTAVEACVRVAEEIWQGARTHLSERLGGLASEDAVRSRLRVLAGPLNKAQDLTPDARAIFERIDFVRDDPLAVREQCEALVAAQLPGRFASLEPIAEETRSTPKRVTRLVIVQSVAGRLGRWAVRDGEIDDAKLARGLFRRAPSREDADREALVEAAEAAFREGRLDDATRLLLEADRARRSPDVLYKLAVARFRASAHAEARWAIRACLLEDVEEFEGPEALLRAHAVESGLAALAEQAPRERAAPPATLEDEALEDEATEFIAWPPPAR
jgi:hypothetical protein